MIGKVSRGKNFSSTIRYVLGPQKKAQVIFANLAEAFHGDVETIVDRFSNQASLNLRVKKPVYHLSISPAIDDSLSNADWSELVFELVDELELNHHQVIAAIHQDTYFPHSNKLRKHLHLVANAVGFDCQCANFYYDYYKIENFLRNFEQQRNLTQLGFDWTNFWSARNREKTQHGDWTKDYAQELKLVNNQHGAWTMGGNTSPNQRLPYQVPHPQLPKQSQKASSISTELVYNNFLNYFKSVDEFSNITHQEKYQVDSKTFGEITLNSSKNNQTISLVKDNIHIYYAELQNNQWQEKKNILSEQQIMKLKQLPQTQEQVAEDYSTKYLANFLQKRLLESNQIEKTIKWKFDDQNKRVGFYTFKVAHTSNPEQISILGKDKNDLDIFTAEIKSNGVIHIAKNQIPLNRIEKLIEQQNQSRPNQATAMFNPDKLVRKPKLTLKRSR